MKKIVKKRIVLYCPWTGEEVFGAEEFDGMLSDNNILGYFHEIGKTDWLPTHPDYNELWYLVAQNGVQVPHYKVTVDKFYIEAPSIWDKIKSALC